MAEQTKRPRRTSVEIKSFLEIFKQSGSNTKEFCKTHGINRAAFYGWKRRYALKVPLKKSSFLLLEQLPVPSTSDPALFAEVKGIKIYQSVEASYLKELLA